MDPSLDNLFTHECLLLLEESPVAGDRNAADIESVLTISRPWLPKVGSGELRTLSVLVYLGLRDSCRLCYDGSRSTIVLLKAMVRGQWPVVMPVIAVLTVIVLQAPC